MSQAIVSESGTALILGAGPVSQADFDAVAGLWSGCICLDGGLVRAQDLGLTPDCVIGDLDSLPEDLRAAAPGLVHVPDQDTTDFQKGLAAVEADVILALGVLGGRLDHHLASLSAALKDPRPVLLVGGGEVSVMIHGALNLTLALDVPVSLYPLLPVVAVTTRGLVWPVTGQPMAPDGLIGTSNRMAQPDLYVEASGKGLLLTVPLEWIGAVIKVVKQPQPGQPE